MADAGPPTPLFSRATNLILSKYKLASPPPEEETSPVDPAPSPLFLGWLKALFTDKSVQRLDAEAITTALADAGHSLTSADTHQALALKASQSGSNGGLTFADCCAVLSNLSLCPNPDCGGASASPALGPTATKQRNAGKIVVVQGSVRAGCNTLRCAALVMDELVRVMGLEAELVDLTDFDLPFPGKDHVYDNADAAALRKVVGGAAGVIFATPEYHGTFTSSVKLCIENLGYPSVLVGKPCLILGVASGALGGIKSIEHLSSVLHHCGALVLPGSASVAEVHLMFDKNGDSVLPKTDLRVRGLAHKMADYATHVAVPAKAKAAMSRSVGLWVLVKQKTKSSANS